MLKVRIRVFFCAAPLPSYKIYPELQILASLAKIRRASDKRVTCRKIERHVNAYTSPVSRR